MEKIKQKLKNKEAFTLIEMLIVLFIIAILLILIIPNITKNIDTAKDKSSEASTAPNGKKIVIANGKATLEK